MDTSSPLLEFEEVFYTYPDGTRAIEGVSLRLGPGEVAALLGENGSGKTTLAKLAMGLILPDKGRVLVQGVDTREASTYEIARKVGMVFQNPDHQIFEKTVFDEVAFALRNYGFSEEKVGNSVQRELRRFGLLQYARAMPTALSGGERKRVAFASSFVLGPEVLFLDEPTKGLEEVRKVRLANMARELARQGKAIVFITHDVEFASHETERAVVMHSGHILLDGTTRKVLADARIAEARLLPPQVRLLTAALQGLDLPDGLLNAREFCESLLRLLK